MTMQKRTARDLCCNDQHGMITRMSVEMPMTVNTLTVTSMVMQGRGQVDTERKLLSGSRPRQAESQRTVTGSFSDFFSQPVH